MKLYDVMYFIVKKREFRMKSFEFTGFEFSFGCVNILNILLSRFEPVFSVQLVFIKCLFLCQTDSY